MAEKILITGGAGFIGSHIADHFLGAGHQVVIVDDLSTGRRENVPSGVTLFEADITDREALEEAFRREKPTVVSHHAAQINVRRSVEDPAADAHINIVGMLRVIEAARSHGVKRVIFASSGGAVYGEPEEIPVPESSSLHPISPYGVAKLAGEHYLACAAATYGMSTVSLRYANVYGPRQDPQGEAGVISIFIDRILQGEMPVVFGDGKQTRDYVYVGDVARANVAALAKGDGIYNIGTGKETSVLELLDTVRDKMGCDGPVRHEDERAGEVRRTALDCCLARKELGWRAGTDLGKGLARTVAWHREKGK